MMVYALSQTRKTALDVATSDAVKEFLVAGGAKVLQSIRVSREAHMVSCTFCVSGPDQDSHGQC